MSSPSKPLAIRSFNYHGPLRGVDLSDSLGHIRGRREVDQVTPWQLIETKTPRAVFLPRWTVRNARKPAR